MKVKLLNDNVLKPGDKKGDVVEVENVLHAHHLIKVGAVEEVKEAKKAPAKKKQEG